MAKRRKSVKPKVRTKGPTEPASGIATNFPAPTEAAVQINRLMESLDTYTEHRVECWGCGEEDAERDVTEARFAQSLYKAGWRYVASEKFATEGTLCPECAATPDAELGDE